MWDKIFALFNKDLTDENAFTLPSRPEQVTLPEAPASDNQISKPDGQSVNIGYSYLKGLDGESEDSSKHIRRFTNLNKFLRGQYNGKIAATHAEPEGDVRGEDSE